ncbi:MAG: peptide deformylase [Thermoleophilaceae bacterium]|nr:peptide deformylase [Thermoleophilaceae bacterium]
MSEEHLDDVVEVAPDADDDHDEHEVLDPQIAARRAAALAHIRRFGDPVLKSRAAQVDRFDKALHDQIDRMVSLMHDALGIGLAAPQIGISQQLLVYRVGPDGPVVALVNPQIEWTSDAAEEFEEGCLSIPGILVDVERPVHVRVRAQDEHGDDRVVEASGLEARVIQHELDHLNGVLILDRTTKDQRKEAIRALRDAEREAA